MAPIKHHAPWQCSQSTCSQVQPNTFNKPSVSLVAPIDNYGHVFVQIEQKQIQALFRQWRIHIMYQSAFTTQNL